MGLGEGLGVGGGRRGRGGAWVRRSCDGAARGHKWAGPRGEGKERAASEMADLLYHSAVLLRKQGVEMKDVMAVLRQRFGTSGVEEKASRKQPA